MPVWIVEIRLRVGYGKQTALVWPHVEVVAWLCLEKGHQSLKVIDG